MTELEGAIEEFEQRVYDCGLYRGGSPLTWDPEVYKRLRALRDKAYEELRKQIAKAERSHR